jgi:hypothetical protein
LATDVLQESSMRATAEAIGISMAATKGRLFHAKKALRKSLISKLKNQPRFDRRIRVLTTAKWLDQNAETNTVRQSTRFHHKKKGDEYVVETENTRKYGNRNHIHSGGEGRDFNREPGA